MKVRLNASPNGSRRTFFLNVAKWRMQLAREKGIEIYVGFTRM